MNSRIGDRGFEDLDDDTIVIILQLLDVDDLMQVFPVNKRFCGLAVEAKGWTYFPFNRMTDDSWSSFWTNVWLNERVQTELRYKMNRWVNARCSFKDQTEYDGGDLWEYSARDHWTLYAMYKADEYIEETGAFHDFAHSRMGDDSEEEEDDFMQEWFDSAEYATILEMFKPRPGSYEAQIMYGGANYLARVMLRVARVMFPRLAREETCGSPSIIVRSESLWNAHRDESSRINPHHPPRTDLGEELTVVVPEYRWVLDFVRLKVEAIDFIVKHFKLEEPVWAVADSDSEGSESDAS